MFPLIFIATANKATLSFPGQKKIIIFVTAAHSV